VKNLFRERSFSLLGVCHSLEPFTSQRPPSRSRPISTRSMVPSQLRNQPQFTIFLKPAADRDFRPSGPMHVTTPVQFISLTLSQRRLSLKCLPSVYVDSATNLAMTRPIEVKDPDDPRQVTAYIERQGRRSTSASLNKLLKAMPTPVRDLNLRTSETAFRIQNLTQRVAAAAHLRGQEADSPCNNCQAQTGPFQECVILVGYDDITKGCCTNCQWQLYTSKTRVKGKLCTQALSKSKIISSH